MKFFKTSQEIVNNFSQRFNEMLQSNSNLKEDQVLSLFDSWEKVIGDQKLASYCELYHIKNNTAIIKTSHSGWSQQIFMRRKMIIYNFNKFYPALNINNISVFVDSEFKLKNEDDLSSSSFEINDEFIEEKDEELNEKKELPHELEKALNSLKKAILKKKNKPMSSES